MGPWPDDPRLDPELLADGDRRNVVDRYRYWTVEAIVADLDRRRHPFHVAIENFGHDLNIGTVVRTANAFLAAEVHIVGRRRWNRRGAMVTDRYQHLRHHADVAALLAFADGRGLPWSAVDNGPGAVPLETAVLPRRCLLLFGQEGPGLTARGPRGRRPDRVDRAVRVDPVDQRRGGRRASRCTPGSGSTPTWRGAVGQDSGGSGSMPRAAKAASIASADGADHLDPGEPLVLGRDDVPGRDRVSVRSSISSTASS